MQAKKHSLYPPDKLVHDKPFYTNRKLSQKTQELIGADNPMQAIIYLCNNAA
ncbi:hypothetical protein [Natronogracilivirga saccharolytica]|uniref:hypothetical protein n=1 Tax=Natronogracilivirga saccharolytica TaxID=2812953 RepID=UPI001B3075AB|nr:hypothetical protein [Natronogracilivirga saccharolytica]